MGHAYLDHSRLWIGGCSAVSRLGRAAMEGITLAKLFVFAAVAIGAYVSLLIAYGIGAGSFYKNKHIKAKQRVKKYLRDLSRIEKINNKKEIN